MKNIKFDSSHDIEQHIHSLHELYKEIYDNKPVFVDYIRYSQKLNEFVGVELNIEGEDRTIDRINDLCAAYRASF